MAFGVTDTGYVRKTLSDIKSEIEASLRTALGAGINLQPTELLGQYVGIKSEREALLWELGEGVYNSQYPDTASGIHLDDVISLNGIVRLAASKSTAVVNAKGTESTVIPAGSVISVSGNPSARFVTDGPNTIQAGTDEVQDITFSAVPDTGAFTLIFDGEETASINWNDDNTTVQTALNNLSNLSGVVVTGSFAAGFTVTFSGSDGEQPQNLIQEGGTNTLEASSVPVTIGISETTPGLLPNVDMAVTAETAGAVIAPAGTLTVIESVVSGWDSVTNALDAEVGREIETDPEVRVRRRRSFSLAGSSTIDAIYAKLLQLDGVINARVFHNVTNSTDQYGRPPKSIEAVILGGDDAEIANTIWKNQAGGIELYGSETVQIIDSQGVQRDIKFSRPTAVNIWIEIDVTPGDQFPVDGEDLIKAAIVAYAAEHFSIGNNVVVHGAPSIEAAVVGGEIIGITDLVFRVGKTSTPTLDDNILIAPNEISDIDTSRITVNIL